MTTGGDGDGPGKPRRGVGTTSGFAWTIPVPTPCSVIPSLPSNTTCVTCFPLDVSLPAETEMAKDALEQKYNKFQAKNSLKKETASFRESRARLLPEWRCRVVLRWSSSCSLAPQPSHVP